jgi:hypothetical protein
MDDINIIMRTPNIFSDGGDADIVIMEMEKVLSYRLNV